MTPKNKPRKSKNKNKKKKKRWSVVLASKQIRWLTGTSNYVLMQITGTVGWLDLAKIEAPCRRQSKHGGATSPRFGVLPLQGGRAQPSCQHGSLSLHGPFFIGALEFRIMHTVMSALFIKVLQRFVWHYIFSSDQSYLLGMLGKVESMLYFPTFSQSLKQSIKNQGTSHLSVK